MTDRCTALGFSTAVFLIEGDGQSGLPALEPFLPFASDRLGGARQALEVFQQLAPGFLAQAQRLERFFAEQVFLLPARTAGPGSR